MRIVINVDKGELTEAMLERQLALLAKDLEKYGPGNLTLHSIWVGQMVITSSEGKAIAGDAGQYEVVGLEEMTI
jgi:hypothetical protein